MIDFAFLEKLIDLLNRSNAETIEIRRWWTTVRVSKSGGNSGPVAYHVSPGAGSTVPASPFPVPRGGEEGRGKGEGSAAAQAPSQWLEIKSPMVGTFYARPEPGADPYVRVGSRIKVGTTLCIIEAMKIMNPLDSEISGVIQEVAVDDGQPVEFGQVLFRVDPHG